MIYSRSAEYAIRAFVHLAQVQEGKYAMVKNIAEQEDIPAHFLAKILQQLSLSVWKPVKSACWTSSKPSTAWRRINSAPAV